MIPPDHPLPRYTPNEPGQPKQLLAPQKRRGRNSRTVDLLEHLPHALNIVVVEEPRLAVALVLLERNAERVGDVHGRAVVLPQQHANDSLCGAFGDGTRMVVCYGEED